MNFRYVLNQFGLLLVGLGAVMLVLAVLLLISELFSDRDVDPAARLAMFSSAAVGLAAGGLAWLLTRSARHHLGRREALLLVAGTWIAGGAVAALPFFVWGSVSNRADTLHRPGMDEPVRGRFVESSPDEILFRVREGDELVDRTFVRDQVASLELHPFRRFDNCYFEAVSGMTTTGATVLGDVAGVPPALLLWRALTQWLGGLGIVVLFVAVLPGLGVGGKKLFRVEAPGPAPEGLQPQIRETARTLLYIYLGLSGAQVLLLWMFTEMPLFDAVCHTLATLATGGFGTQNASLGAYDGWAMYTIVIVFMVLAGMNFGLYYQIIRGRVASVFKDTELRLYLVLLALGSLLVWMSIRTGGTGVASTDPDRLVSHHAGRAAAEAVMTTVSVQTTTGFSTSNFNAWPFLAQAVLVLLMFVGGSSGSTSGGIKVIRVWIAFKVMIAEIERVFRPNVIRPVKVGGGTIDDQLKLGTIAYVLGVIVLFTLGAGLVKLFEGADCDFATAAGSSVACLCTIGPGLARVGAIENYGWMTMSSKLVLSLLMVLGRLEVFAIVVLFSPRFWRGN